MKLNRRYPKRPKAVRVSRRYCLICKKITTFKKKRRDAHSYCKVCKGWRAIHPKNLDNVKGESDV